MTHDGIIILKGYGSIEPAWMSCFFALLKRRHVNIRKLVLLQNGHSSSISGHFSQLEVHFVPPVGEEQTVFMTLLQEHLALQTWQEQSLQPAK